MNSTGNGAAANQKTDVNSYVIVPVGLDNPTGGPDADQYSFDLIYDTTSSEQQTGSKDVVATKNKPGRHQVLRGRKLQRVIEIIFLNSCSRRTAYAGTFQPARRSPALGLAAANSVRPASSSMPASTIVLCRVHHCGDRRWHRACGPSGIPTRTPPST